MLNQNHRWNRPIPGFLRDLGTLDSHESESASGILNWSVRLDVKPKEPRVSKALAWAFLASIAWWVGGPPVAAEPPSPSSPLSAPTLAESAALRIVLANQFDPPDPHSRSWLMVDSLYSGVYDQLLAIDPDGVLKLP